MLLCPIIISDDSKAIMSTNSEGSRKMILALLMVKVGIVDRLLIKEDEHVT